MLELILNPNVAYLLLVAGFSLAIMAMMTPGTGLFEIGALFALLLASYAILNLPLNYWALALLALGFIPFFVFALRRNLRRSGILLYLAVAILALIVGSTFLFRGTGWKPAVSPVLALIVSVMTASYFWLAARKVIEAELSRPRHDLAALLGAVGEAKTDILDEGSVHVLGELWSAQSASPIPAGSEIRVVGREGFTLVVEKNRE